MNLFKATIFLVIIWMSTAGVALAQTGLSDKKVLYINSYHNGYAWSDDILKGIRAVLSTRITNLNFQVEYLDAKQYHTASMREIFYQFFKSKFKSHRFDVIITSDNAAFEFALTYRNQLFANVPIVFCGLNDFHPDMLKNQTHITGIEERIDFKENLAIARRLHPGAGRMVVIGNDRLTSRAIIQEIRKAVKTENIDFPISFLPEFHIDELKPAANNFISRLPSDTLIYITPVYEEKNGMVYNFRQISQMVCNAAQVPVYSFWDFLAGTGIVGGKLVSGVVQGRTAALLAVRILNGEDPDSIPVQSPGGQSYIFDYNALKKFNIDAGLLPENSTIINQPYDFYRLNRQFVWAIMGTMTLLAGLVVLLVLNMDQKRKANLAMEASKQQLRLIFDSIPHLVFWQDKNLNLVDVNQSFLTYFKVDDKKAIIGRDISSVPYLARTAEESRQLGRQVIKTATPCFARLFKIEHSDTEHLWLEINKIPLLNKRGEVDGVLSTAEDITKKINLEKQLAQSQKMEALGILSGGIAHDFNNILTSIINSTELAIDDVPEDSMTCRDLNRVLSAGKRGADLVKQILTFSRPGQVRFKKMDLARVVQDAMAFVETSLPGNIEVITTIAPGKFWCQGAPTQIHQVILNLCTNSFQAMGGMGGRLEVSLGHRTLDTRTVSNGDGIDALGLPDGDYLELAVADNGPGIDAEILEKIFDPFFSTKNKNIGTGLGLSMVHGIVQGHNGGITIASRQFELTKFTILIPKKDQGEEEYLPDEERARTGKGRILFVEDEQEQRDSVPRIIEKLGYQVACAENAAAAITIIEKDPHGFDLVITDYDMPKTSGLDLAKHLGNLRPGLPVIMVSGRNVEFSRKESANIRQFIVKPYNKSILSKAIGNVI